MSPSPDALRTRFAVLNRPDSRRVLVGAHADDESLFASGLALRYPGDWTIVCCSIPYNEPLRAWKFFDACRALGAQGRLLPWAEKRNAPLEHLERLDDLLNAADIVVTHGEKGEYGHPGHLSVHDHIAKQWTKKALFIGYGMEDVKKETLALNEAEWARKRAVIGSYNQTMRWSGRIMPVHEALLLQYHRPEGKFDLQNECFYATDESPRPRIVQKPKRSFWAERVFRR